MREVTPAVRSQDEEGAGTRTLLLAGAVAGPLFAVVALIQTVIRPGFDLARDQVSLLSNGDLGWLQVGNFLVAGALFIAGAIGMRRATAHSTRPSRWAPRLMLVFGASQLAAAVFTADPAFGFPPGTPAGPPLAFTWHGGLHLLSAAIGLLAIAAAAFLMAGQFGRLGRPVWAAWSRIAGAALLLGFAVNGAMAGQAIANIGFTVAALHAYLWTSAVAASARAHLDG
jgi:hypothetical protein